MTDFAKMFTRYGIPYRTDVNKGWINVNCPFCTMDQHFNGGFPQGGKSYNCWRCGPHPQVEALSKILNLPKRAVIQAREDFPWLGEPPAKKRVSMARHLDFPGLPLNEAERKYLEGRGLEPRYCTGKFGIMGGGISGEWRYRILIPVYLDHALVSWTGRSILSRDVQKEYGIPRYKNLSVERSIVNPKEIVFNTDNSRKDAVILVEGPMDVVSMGDDCICSLGTGVTDEQIAFIAEHWGTVYVAFDNEPEAQKKARHVAMNLSSLGVHSEVVDFLSEIGRNDPGEMTREEVASVKQELGL